MLRSKFAIIPALVIAALWGVSEVCAKPQAFSGTVMTSVHHAR